MIHYPQKHVFSACHLLKFWEISDNISETVQDRDIVAIEDYYEIVCGLSNGIIASALE